MVRRTEWPEESGAAAAGAGAGRFGSDGSGLDGFGSGDFGSGDFGPEADGSGPEGPGPGGRSRGGRRGTAGGRSGGGRRGFGESGRGRSRSRGDGSEGVFEDAPEEDSGSFDPSRAGAEEPRDGGRGRGPRERDLDPGERARAICLRLLTGMPRTRKQLADALRKREIPDEVADEVLSRFEEVGLIDDAAFAGAWVESRHHGRGLARRALAQELRTKGVDPTTIEEAVGQLDSEQEEATARELVARKLRATRGLERDKRVRRLAGMLARRGYSEGMALRVVRDALAEDEG
ncbi:recombination regulator RecX [Streptomyces sp. NBC_01304]|uniref:recombination regulator RecX n=1 Tax=Streptomyces sp. NBC_01304 TaxID=2903818 RepID=UPI002E14CF0D|nr:recombination regulator RecX [Streptomyces sp. NBC_01304]